MWFSPKGRSRSAIAHLIALSFLSGTLLFGLADATLAASSCVSCHNAQGSSVPSDLHIGGGSFPLVSYALNVSESLPVLLHPNDPSVKWMAAWTTPTELAMERNQPYFMLTNTSTADHGGTGSAALTTFHMTIGDKSQNFDWLKIDAAHSSPGITLVSLAGVDTINGGLRGDDITMTFSGFTPGKQLVFQVDLDPDKASANPFSDYRNVLFTLNGGANTSGNSVTGASFFDSTLDPSQQSFTLPDTPMDNPVDTGPTSFGMNFSVGYMDDHVSNFGTGGAGAVPQVPEPSAIILAGVGSFGLWLTRRKLKQSR